MSNLNVYCVRDSVADDSFVTFTALNDAMAIRDNLPALSRVRPVKDLIFYCVGSFDSVSMVLSACPPRQVSLDSYKFPEQKVNSHNVNVNFDKNESDFLKNHNNPRSNGFNQ